MGLKVEMKMLPMKAHYFLYNGATGSVVPFMPVYARQLGFSSFVVGSIYSVLPILGLVAKPLFGALADRYQRHKAMFIFFVLLTAAAFMSIKYIDPIPQKTNIAFHCNDGVSVLKYCPDKLDTCASKALLNYTDEMAAGPSKKQMDFQLSCTVSQDWIWNFICSEWNNNTNCVKDDDKLVRLNATVYYNEVEEVKQCLFFEINRAAYHHKGQVNTLDRPVICPKAALQDRSLKLQCKGEGSDQRIMNVITEPSIYDNDATSFPQFWKFFFGLAFSWVGMAVVVSVGDAICFDLLGEKHRSYGRQRLWGAVGWGVFSIVAGWMVDESSIHSTYKNYSVVFYLMLAAIFPDALVSGCLKYNPSKMSSNIAKDIGKLFGSLRIIVFFLWCIVVGLCTALVWNFLFWHLEELADQKDGCDQQARMKTLQGLAMGIQCFGGELPFFFISGWLLTKIGHVNAMTLVLFTFGLRLCLYSLLSNPWLVLPIELMQGITFGIFYSTMATYASIVAPAGTAATLQGLVGAIFEGVGVSTGSFFGGLFMNTVGGSATFRIFGLMALACAFLHFAVQKILDRYTTERGKDYNYSDQNKKSGGGVNTLSVIGERTNGVGNDNNKSNLLQSNGHDKEFIDVSLEDVSYQTKL